MVCTQMGIKKLKKLEIKKIKDLKIGIGIEKKQRKQGLRWWYNFIIQLTHLYLLHQKHIEGFATPCTLQRSLF